MAIAKEGALTILPALLAIAAGWTDCHSRRIPNWLTVPGLLLGIAVNSWLRGWPGTKDSLLGAGLGLALLLPFVLINSLGAGDWKFVGALGAFLGPQNLLTVLLLGILVNGAMAAIMIVRKKRVRQTVRNLGRMLGAFLSLHLPGPDLTLDNPDLVKVPFGVAVAIAVIIYMSRQAWRIA
jgi:prepilin peptidase CpaA